MCVFWCFDKKPEKNSDKLQTSNARAWVSKQRQEGDVEFNL
jgi:hypothetical protein